MGVCLSFSISPQVGGGGSPKGSSTCLSKLIDHLLLQGVGMGRCLTRIVNHPPEWEDLQIDMRLEGCLVKKYSTCFIWLVYFIGGQ